MWQEILIGLLFLGAIGFLTRTVYNHFKNKNACKTGCGSCSIDFEKIENQINSQKS